jgi:hypothetical protein
MISRKKIGLPIMTAIVELNGKEAYEALGQKIRAYPRFLPVPDTVVTYDKLIIRDWYEDISIFPECIMILGNNIELGEYNKVQNPILGYGIGIGLYHNSMVSQCKGGTPRDIQINKWYEYYTAGTKVQREYYRPVDQVPDIRKINLEISIDGITSKSYQHSNIMFDESYILEHMSKYTPFKKYDIICLGPVAKPVEIPNEHRFKSGDSIKVSGEPFGEFVIDIEDRRV